MGLLSDPEYGSVKWVKMLKKINFPLCCLCYVGSILWFFMLAHPEFNNETYFSENALLPGLVRNEFNGEHSANKFFTEFVQELEDKYEDTNEMPVEWLVAKMSQLGLEVYTHNFTLNYPFGQEQTYQGTNVYGILRAPRTSSLEALVVTAPYRSLSNHQKGTAAGIALMLAFAQFARPQNYWAKDIIFLITEHEQLGMQAWLEAYHGLQQKTSTFYTSLGSFQQIGFNFEKPKILELLIPSHTKSLDPGVLKGRSGSIQAAINLEFHTPKFKYIEVKVEGLNGQLPNLDLVNLAHKLCVLSDIHHSYQNSFTWLRSRNNIDEWVYSIWTMLKMAAAQIPGVPNGNHGLFLPFGIDAITLEGRELNDPAGDPPRAQYLSTRNFYLLGITLERVLRSLNNLLERFHQSYFFYMLAATNRYISIGQYMPSLCLLCGAMLTRALFLWVTLQQDEDIDKQDEKDKSVKEKETLENTEEKPDKNIDNEEKESLIKDVVKSEEDKTKAKEDKEEPKEVGIKAKEDEIEPKENEIKAKEDEIKPKEEKIKAKEDEIKPKEEKIKANEDEIKAKEEVEENISIALVGLNYFVVHFMGYATICLPEYFDYIGTTFLDLAPEASIFYGLMAYSVFLIFLAPYSMRIPLTFEEMSILNILLLIELATACLAIGMHNFPLGLFIAVLYTPLALLVGVVGQDRGKRGAIVLFFKRVLCLLLQPLFVVTIAMIIYSWFLFPEEGVLSMISRGKDAAVQGVMFSVVDSEIYGNWLFQVVSVVIFPTWILFWQILCKAVINY